MGRPQTHGGKSRAGLSGGRVHNAGAFRRFTATRTGSPDRDRHGRSRTDITHMSYLSRRLRWDRAFKGYQAVVCLAFLLSHGTATLGGNQLYEPLVASVQARLHNSLVDGAPQILAFESKEQARTWLDTMSGRLTNTMPDRYERERLLVTVHYEASRAGLDPQMVLGLIQVESAFRPYAISSAGARGLMQVMPFWIDAIGSKGDNLFELRTNLRYGCVILRHYLDMESGDLNRALGRYNGSLGRMDYPNQIYAAWHGWLVQSAAPTSAVNR